MGVSGALIKAACREIVVNGKKYDSVDAMPPDVRRTYEQAIARVGPGGAAVRPPVVAAARAIRPPQAPEDEPRGGGMWRDSVLVGPSGPGGGWVVPPPRG